MISKSPWQQLATARKSLGLTQSECAKGIVTQSMLCQIERGRVLPSDRTLCQLAQRLSIDAASMVEQWQPWRARRFVRDSLWIAFGTDCSTDILQLLDAHAEILAPFEVAIYQAIVAAREGDVVRADYLVSTAWIQFSWGEASAVHAYPQGPLTDVPWSKIEYARTMVVEASVHVEVSERLQRTGAATWWRARVAQRMKQTAWQSKRVEDTLKSML